MLWCAMTDRDREAQIVALWQGRPRDRRRSEDVLPFYHWLVEYAPWLAPPDVVSLDQIRALVEAHTVNSDTVSDPLRKARRQRLRRRG